ncbi:hypothetical protein HMPREF1573_00857 [Gardnerella vaginalis JCP7276]|nr:hypothetical protein HMPREF1573_00857 [Gardnerella vaginalis JCP7276]
MRQFFRFLYVIWVKCATKCVSCVMRTVQNARFVFGCRSLKLVRV